MTFRDFEEFIASLNAHGVRYLIVGGYAVGFHALPRATKDIDVLVDPTLPNARRLREALVAFLGVEAAKLSLSTLTNPRTLVVLGVAPIRIDVLTSILGVPSFAAAWRRRSNGRYGRTPAAYLCLEDLLRAKIAAGRPQDLADVEALRRARAQKRPANKSRRPRRGTTKRRSR